MTVRTIVSLFIAINVCRNIVIVDGVMTYVSSNVVHGLMNAVE